MGLKTEMNALLHSAVSCEAPSLDAGQTSALYERMLLIRRFEEKVGQLLALGAIDEAPALASARESIPACMAQAMSPGDRIVSSTGPMAVLLSRNVSPRELCAALIEKRDVRALGAADVTVLASSAADALRASAAKPNHGTIDFCWVEAARETIPHLRTLDALGGGRVVCLELRSGREGEESEALEIDSRHALAQGNCPVMEADGIDAGRLLTVLTDATHLARTEGRTCVVLVRTHAFHGHAPVRGGQSDAGREAWDPIARLRARILEDSPTNEASLKAFEKSARERVSAAASAARGLQ